VVEVPVSSISVSVLGGPDSISVQSDIGPQGRRGSLIFSSIGNPNGAQSGVPSDSLLNDLAIDVLSGSDSYLAVFQYQATPAGNTWIELTRLLPSAQSIILERTFNEEGVAEVLIPVNSIISINPSIVPENFSIQFSILDNIINGVPANLPVISSSISLSPEFFTDNGVQSLAFAIKAYTINPFDGYSIAPLEGTFDVNLFITLTAIEGA
jgi:hypothetical protein